MKRTFLLFITPSRIGGAERYFFQLARHLGESGHRVLVVTKRDAELRREIEAANLLNVTVYGWRTHGKVDPLTLGRLYRLIRRERVDLINAFSTSAAWIGSLAGKLTGVPVVARIPATDSLTFYRYADLFVAVSEGIRDYLIDRGIAPGRIHVFYNGVDFRRYRNALPMQAAKERLGLPPDALTVGVVASLTRRKGHRFLLEALGRIGSEFGEMYLLLAGEGDQEEPLRQQAAELGLDERVHFLGFRQDVKEVVSALDVFVLPSLKEGLSNAVMEAMALSRPVIATRIAGQPEIVRHEETGLLVPPGDVDALEDAVRCLLRDREKATRFGRNGRALLEEKFDQASCLAAVERFFLHLIDSWHSGQRTMTDGVSP